MFELGAVPGDNGRLLWKFQSTPSAFETRVGTLFFVSASPYGDIASYGRSAFVNEHTLLMYACRYTLYYGEINTTAGVVPFEEAQRLNTLAEIKLYGNNYTSVRLALAPLSI